MIGNKEPALLVFETAWGWCGAAVSHRGLVAFQLPMRDEERAARLLREHASLRRRNKDTDALAQPIPAFKLKAGPGDVASKTGRESAGAVVGQVRAYFEGSLRHFDISLDWRGRSEFQCGIWRALRRVPYGGTISYGDLAAKAGRPGAARAVGRAMAVNPVPLIVPCHRVVGSDGGKCGFSARGGVQTKQRLLRFEAERLAAGACRGRMSRVNSEQTVRRLRAEET